jgi:hydrogenase maturation protein HypF
LPDLATCADCLREVFDPNDRRFRYPFTNCTNCGPRFSIIESIPYDRGTTTMKHFEMCELCRAEYEDPSDRRFHAQPNACPECGPQLILRGPGEVLGQDDAALVAAVDAIRDGKIVAVKGLGGFPLMVDATNDDAVRRLRGRKRRPGKPLAVMFPDLEAAEGCCEVSEAERKVLRSAASPMVLLRRRSTETDRGEGASARSLPDRGARASARSLPDRGERTSVPAWAHNGERASVPAWFAGALSPAVAPENPYIGAFLPYTPLHHLLLDDLGVPVVATSGNLSSEPICTDGSEAMERLGAVADLFLDHDRPIRRPVEDSVVFVFRDQETVVRRGRGYAPAPVVSAAEDVAVTAVGGDLKGASAITKGDYVILGPHVGDLSDVHSQDVLWDQLRDLRDLYDVSVESTACDMHPDYHSSRMAEEFGPQVVRVQHHHAHIASVMAECDLSGPVLGVAWDGTGWGTDETIWGGEFLVVDRLGFERVAHLARFDLPGGDAAAREPRRSALGVRRACDGEESRVEHLFEPEQFAVVSRMLDRGVRTVSTSSAGRLFDAVACLLEVGPPVATFEAEAAMALEFAALDTKPAALAEMELADGRLDWRPTVVDLLERRGRDRSALAAGFHAALAEGIVRTAEQAGLEDVVLVGGCFQNRVLLGQAVSLLEEAGFNPQWSRLVPPGDGGLAVGQAVVAAGRDG